MNYAYDATGWQNFYVCVGGAAAALAGLLFVGLTLKLDAVIHRPRPRGRALGTLVALFTLLVVSVFVLVPGQPSGLLGLELVLVGAAVLTWTVSLE